MLKYTILRLRPHILHVIALFDRILIYPLLYPSLVYAIAIQHSTPDKHLLFFINNVDESREFKWVSNFVFINKKVNYSTKNVVLTVILNFLKLNKINPRVFVTFACGNAKVTINYGRTSVNQWGPLTIWRELRLGQDVCASADARPQRTHRTVVPALTL